MYGNIETYTEYVWNCERIGNVYGNIKKYKEYVWKHKEICPGIHDSECARGSLGSQPVNQQPIAKYSKPLRKTKKNKKNKVLDSMTAAWRSLGELGGDWRSLEELGGA